jgi:hypothetical protein
MENRRMIKVTIEISAELIEINCHLSEEKVACMSDEELLRAAQSEDMPIFLTNAKLVKEGR